MELSVHCFAYKFLPNVLLTSPNPSHSSNLKSKSSYLRGVRLNSLKFSYNKDLRILPAINLGDQTFIHTHTHTHAHAHIFITEELKEMSFDMDHADEDFCHLNLLDSHMFYKSGIPRSSSGSAKGLIFFEPASGTLWML